VRHYGPQQTQTAGCHAAPFGHRCIDPCAVVSLAIYEHAL
jgi:hypothetical protein